MRIILLAAACIGLAAFSAQAAEPLRLSCIAFPPHKMTSDAAGRAGIDLDLINAALDRAGFTATYDFFPWKRAYELAVRGEYDGLCGCSYSPEREAAFRFSDPISPLSVGIFARDRSALVGVTALEGLAGKKVAVVDGYTLGRELEAVGALTVPLASDERAAEFLAQGHADYLYGYKLQTEYWYAMQPNAPRLYYRQVVESETHLCLSRKRDDADAVILKINEGLASIKADGTEASIRARYETGASQPIN